MNNIFSVVALDHADYRDGAVAAGVTILILAVVVITSIILAILCILK